jgi:hypothetical protein
VEPEPLARHTLTLPWWLMCGTLVKGGNYAPECLDAFEQTQARGGAGQVAALRVFVVLLASNAGDGNRDFIDPTTSGRASLALTSRAHFRHVDAGGPALGPRYTTQLCWLWSTCFYAIYCSTTLLYSADGNLDQPPTSLFLYRYLYR